MAPAHTATVAVLIAVCSTGVGGEALPQTFRSDDPVIRRMWEEGMERSETKRLAQVLVDSIGPRLSGSPAYVTAGEWLLRTYAGWGIGARNEQYGTWRGWQQGATHVDLVAPRVQSLEAELLAWSPGTDGPIEADVVALPEIASGGDADSALRAVAGRFVLVAPPEPMCRAPHELTTYARPETVERLADQRQEIREAWSRRAAVLGNGIERRVEAAGALGIVTSRWAGGWGVQRVGGASAEGIVTVALSCEDYGLVFRLAANDQGPRLRIDARAEALGDVPMFNVIAELEGTELPDEYVILSAHLDSWHGATGATDNGTGTITMLEAMRILRAAYPNPRRTILAAHWGGEEQGLIGSRAFAEDHPDVLDGIQVLWNQDNGTWRVEIIETQGFQRAGANVAQWMSHVPDEIARHVRLEFPGRQENRGSDHSSFVCRGVPAFRLQSSYAEYRQYTHHTNRDTYDKIVFDDLRNNATLAAMLAYLASEDPERVPRDRAVLPPDPRTGEPRPWPDCSPARREWRGGR